MIFYFFFAGSIPIGSPQAASTPKTSIIQEALESTRIIRQPEDNIESLGVVRPDPIESIDLSQSQVLEVEDFDDYEGGKRENCIFFLVAAHSHNYE